MAQKWYVVHTYSGFENKVKSMLEEKIKLAKKEDCFSEILVPAEKVIEMIKGKKKATQRKFFPGYILVKMELNDETWHIVKNTPKVTGFVGDRANPTALTDEEVEEIKNQMSEGLLRPKHRVTFEKGDQVRVVDGPFSNFNGLVETVNPEKGKVRVLVSIFGRSTPVELDFAQIKKA
ncbi:MAG: transcription termination/antitermination protein NusG [Thermodesulfobacteriota bacterium]